MSTRGETIILTIPYSFQTKLLIVPQVRHLSPIIIWLSKRRRINVRQKDVFLTTSRSKINEKDRK